MQRKRRQRNRKKKAGGQNKGIVEEEAPFGLDALMWKRNGKVAIEDGDDGYDWGFPAEAWLPAVRNLTRSPTEVVTHSESQKSDPGRGPVWMATGQPWMVTRWWDTSKYLK